MKAANLLKQKVMMLAAGLLGLGLTVFLVVHAGVSDILKLLAVAGWGLLWLLPFHLLPLSLDVLGWKWLLRGKARVRFWFLLWVALVREAANGLLPVARVGGEVLGVRLLTYSGVPGYVAGASVMVEVTLTLLSQFIFTLAGFVVLIFAVSDHHLQFQVVFFLALILPLLMAFIWVQYRWGLFTVLQMLMKKLLGGKDLLALIGEPQRLDAEIRRLYARRWGLLPANFWQLSGLLAGTAEVWFTFWLLGHPLPFWAALLLESLGQALRSMAFLVPGGLGVQEGGFILFGSAIGIGPDLALAFSLTRRFRETLMGIPVLLSWQVLEGHHMHRHWRQIRSNGEGIS